MEATTFHAMYGFEFERVADSFDDPKVGDKVSYWCMPANKGGATIHEVKPYEGIFDFRYTIVLRRADKTRHPEYITTCLK